MPIYRVRRHVIPHNRTQGFKEVWGIDRPAVGLNYVSGPHDTDKDDPLLDNKEDGCGCRLLLKTADGKWVTWERFWTWLSEAEEVGYELISGYKNISPYSTLIIRGPAAYP